MPGERGASIATKWGHTRPKGISPKMVGLAGLVGRGE
jgi:hypothetical protein